jgi:hypothetical protein
MNTSIHILSYLAHFFLEWKILQTVVVDKIKTHILCSVMFFLSKIVLFVRKCGKNIVEWVRPQDNMAYANCVLDTPGYKHTLRSCNTRCFSTATLVVRTRLDVRLYAHCLSCLYSCYVPNFMGDAAAVICRSTENTNVALLVFAFFSAPEFFSVVRLG